MQISGIDQNRTTSLSVLVPVYNEEYLVEASLARLEVLGISPWLHRVQVIVIDNGSVDGTRHSLRRFQETLHPGWGAGKFDWKFVRVEPNQGRGGATQTALEHAECELSVVHDADLEYYPQDLLKMVPLFIEERADAVFGSRFRGAEFRQLLFLRHTLGNRVVTFLGGVLSNADLSDLVSCYKMVRTELYRSIPFEFRDFRMEAELAIKLIKRQARVFEVPIRYSGRTIQEGKKLTIRHVMPIILGVIASAYSEKLYKPDRYGSHLLTRLHHAPKFSRWLGDLVAPHVGSRVLEIGAGIGSLTMQLTPRSTYWATDHNPLYLKTLSRLSANQPFVHTCLTELEDLSSFPEDRDFDTVICRHALEKADDDLAALHNIRAVLKDGGTAIIVVPQGPRMYSGVDKAAGHKRRYSAEDLERAAARCGLELCHMIPFNRSSSPFWMWDGRVARQDSVGIGRIKLYNFFVPLLRRVDALLPFPPLSLIGIFRKGPLPAGSDVHFESGRCNGNAADPGIVESRSELREHSVPLPPSL